MSIFFKKNPCCKK